MGQLKASAHSGYEIGHLPAANNNSSAN